MDLHATPRVAAAAPTRRAGRRRESRRSGSGPGVVRPAPVRLGGAPRSKFASRATPRSPAAIVAAGRTAARLRAPRPDRRLPPAARSIGGWGLRPAGRARPRRESAARPRPGRRPRPRPRPTPTRRRAGARGRREPQSPTRLRTRPGSTHRTPRAHALRRRDQAPRRNSRTSIVSPGPSSATVSRVAITYRAAVPSAWRNSVRATRRLARADPSSTSGQNRAARRPRGCGPGFSAQIRE